MLSVRMMALAVSSSVSSGSSRESCQRICLRDVICWRRLVIEAHHVVREDESLCRDGVPPR